MLSVAFAWHLKSTPIPQDFGRGLSYIKNTEFHAPGSLGLLQCLVDVGAYF